MTELDESILRSLRRISRAVGLYSRQLANRFHLTTPQLVCLRVIAQGACSPGEVAKAASLSPPTVTGILDRLEGRGLLTRRRHERDKRRLCLELTEEGSQLLESAPKPLHETFSAHLCRLEKARQEEIDRVLKRVVEMMEAEHLEALPILDPSPDSYR